MTINLIVISNNAIILSLAYFYLISYLWRFHTVHCAIIIIYRDVINVNKQIEHHAIDVSSASVQRRCDLRALAADNAALMSLLTQR